MPKRSSKPQGRRDENEVAAGVVRQIIASNDPLAQEPEPAPAPAKNPAAVALGRLGGKKGGKARAAALSGEQRRAIAKKAAAKRWEKPRQ